METDIYKKRMVTTVKIGIREFGPLKEGTGADMIDIKKCTLFIGPQGSGKSSVAKLATEFAWLEKALVKGIVSMDELQRKNRFRDRYCNYHRLSSFFRAGTVIRYCGKYHDFEYSGERLRVMPRRGGMSGLSKIMYAPAERNVLGVMEKPGMSRYFTDSLRTFWEAYEDARMALKADLELPVDGMRFTYDRLNKIGWVKGDAFRTRLSEAASGYQSLVPLFLVCRYMANWVDENLSVSEGNTEDYRRLQKEVDAIMKNRELTDDVRTAALESRSARYRYSSFVNVVEEPELNLYPVTQRDLLRELILVANRRADNQLIVTTHSPYILSALNNLLYAAQVGRKHPAEIKRIVSEDCWMPASEVAAYALENGKIVSIMDEELQQIAAERIDGVSEELNREYEQLLDLDC